MDTIAELLQSFFSGIGPFFILLGLLIFVHELGHFMVAKFCGVRVEVFSLGFGKKIATFIKGDTTYCISLIPLGGYVKMYGDDPTAEVPEDQKSFAFLEKPVSQRIAIVLAGPLMNFFFAAFLFTVIALIGQKMPDTTVGDISPGSQAYVAGIRSGDKITTVNGQTVQTWKQFNDILENSGNKPLNFGIQRGKSLEPIEISTTPKMGPNPNILSGKSVIGKIEGLDLTSKAPIVGISNPNSLAGKVGIDGISLIKSINGQEISYYREINPAIEAAIEQNKPLKIEYRAYSIEDKKETDPPLKTANITWPQEVGSSDKLKIQLGFSDPQLFLLGIKKNSPAEISGLKKGDKVLALNGNEVSEWKSIVETVKSYKKDQGPIKFTVERRGTPVEISVTPKMTELLNHQGQDDHRFTVGIVPALASVTGPLTNFKISNPVQAVVHGFERTLKWTELVAYSFYRLVQGSVSTKNIGGIITIGKVASDSFRAGLDRYLMMMAIISVNLFLLNLLPVPVLDGGHLVFFTIEALRGAPLSLKKMEIAQQVGLVLLISLMVFSIFNDISNIFSSPW